MKVQSYESIRLTSASVPTMTERSWGLATRLTPWANGVVKETMKPGNKQKVS